MSKEQREKLERAVERDQNHALGLLDRAKIATPGNKRQLVRRAEKYLDRRDEVLGILES